MVKRYLDEAGTEALDAVYEALEGDARLDVRAAFSAWNLGEVVGAIDAREQRGDIDAASMNTSIGLFVGETRKFVAMRKLDVLAVSGRMLNESRDLIVKHHIYQADALQIATARQSDASLFLTADKRLAECAQAEGLEVANPERDQKKVSDALNGSSRGRGPVHSL